MMRYVYLANRIYQIKLSIIAYADNMMYCPVIMIIYLASGKVYMEGSQVSMRFSNNGTTTYIIKAWFI